MTTIAYPLGVTFGSAKTGLAASILAACVDAGGTTRSLGSLTWAEETDAAASASTGVYSATANLDTAWVYPLKIKYTITGQSGVAARATITAAELSAFDTAGNLNVNAKDWNGTAIASTVPLAASAYTTPPTAAAVRIEMDDNSTKLAGIATGVSDTGSTLHGAITDALATLTSRTDPSTVLAAIKTVTDKYSALLNGGGTAFTAPALANAPTGGGGSTGLTDDQATQLSETHARALLALPNAAPGASGGLARTEDVSLTIIEEG